MKNLFNIIVLSAVLVALYFAFPHVQKLEADKKVKDIATKAVLAAGIMSTGLILREFFLLFAGTKEGMVGIVRGRPDPNPDVQNYMQEYRPYIPDGEVSAITRSEEEGLVIADRGSTKNHTPDLVSGADFSSKMKQSKIKNIDALAKKGFDIMHKKNAGVKGGDCSKEGEDMVNKDVDHINPEHAAFTAYRPCEIPVTASTGVMINEDTVFSNIRPESKSRATN